MWSGEARMDDSTQSGMDWPKVDGWTSTSNWDEVMWLADKETYWELRDELAGSWWHWLDTQQQHSQRLRAERSKQPNCAERLRRFYLVHYLMIGL